jgi:hypothetical protein
MRSAPNRGIPLKDNLLPGVGLQSAPMPAITIGASL